MVTEPIATPLETVSEAQLALIRRYTRRPFAPEELYTFGMTLCDNEVDRDGERFSDEALEQLAELLVGKTGIFDHDPKGENQTARLFDCRVEEVPGRMTAAGVPYKYLKGYAYMVRTDRCRDLILEIEGGIKKEVSISCRAEGAVCSICGASRSQGPCGHEKGQRYAGRLCHTVLGQITDAYEWSFVAVPAQPAAGVTKGRAPRDAETVCKALEAGETTLRPGEGAALAKHLRQLEQLAQGGRTYRERLRRETCGLLAATCPQLAAETAVRMTEGLSIGELERCAKALAVGAPLPQAQLSGEESPWVGNENGAFRMRQ